jgi:dTDP-4-dehydrorhamnose reductase
LKVLLTGRNGQVGSELEALLPAFGPLVATDHARLDLADPDAIRRAVREAAPAVIVNAAAYTAVDRAEEEQELAQRVNGVAPRILAEEAKRLGALLVHYSTDYVFDGNKRLPYVEDDAPNPAGTYGRTKLEGEAGVRGSGCRHLIVRTAWVYGRGGNFVRAILRQAERGAALRVVDDQIGAPTWALDIAHATAKLISKGLEGTFHVSAAGEASWYQVALEILRLAQRPVEIRPVSTAEYGARAPRPQYSVLDNSKLHAAGVAALGDWRGRLAAFVHGLKSTA